MGRFNRADIIRRLSVSYNWEPNEANQSEKQIQSAILRKRKDNCSVCDPFAHAPLKELGGGNVWMPQKYTSSQHGNKCFKEEIRSVTKVGFVSKDKASFVRKDTTGT